MNHTEPGCRGESMAGWDAFTAASPPGDPDRRAPRPGPVTRPAETVSRLQRLDWVFWSGSSQGGTDDASGTPAGDTSGKRRHIRNTTIHPETERNRQERYG